MNWRRTADEKPPNCAPVLVWYEDSDGGGDYGINQWFYLCGAWACVGYVGREITYWMELPEPPGEDGELS